MRVIHVVASLIGGAAVQAIQLAEGQLAEGDDVGLVAPHDSPAGAARLHRLPELDWERMALASGWHPGLLKDLRRIIRQQRPDVVHCHGPRGALYGRLAVLGLRPRPRVIYTLHGLHYPHYPRVWQRLAAQLLERLLVWWVDAFICLTEADRERFARTVGAGAARKIHVIPNGVPAPPRVQQPPEVLLQSIGIDAKQCIIGMVVRLRWQKAVHVMLEALPLVRETVPGAQLVVLGDGPLRDELQAQARAAGMDDGVHWLGERKDVWDWLRAFDVFVLPSVWEGIPLALLEAMAAGCPVVATDVPGNRDVIEHETTGLLSPLNAAVPLAEAVVRILTQESFARSLAANATDAWREHYDVHGMVQRSQALYREVIAR